MCSASLNLSGSGPQFNILQLNMSEDEEEVSKPSQWLEGPTGKLSPWALAKVWALHTVDAEYGLEMTNADIAAKVERIGGGSPKDECIRQWRMVFDTDPQWYPGKLLPGQKTAGRKKVITKCR